MNKPTLGSPERELELCRREFVRAEQRAREAQVALDNAMEELVRSAKGYGMADEAARHGGYGPEPE